MERDINPVLDPNNYIQSRTPDVTELSNLIKKAKGPSRTMAEFAEACGISASTFSRIANGKIIQPLSIEVLSQIWLNADSESGVYIYSLTAANGMTSKDFRDRKEGRRPGSYDADERRFSLENEMKNIISTELLERGLGILSQKRVDKDSNIPAAVGGCGRGNLLLKLQGYEPRYWKYQTMAFTGIKRVSIGQEPELGIDYECEADFMFHDEAETFLLDAWETERMHDIKISYVFPDAELFDAFYHRVEKAQVNNWISIIWVDLNRKEVMEEKFLTRRDGRTMSSLFDLPRLSDPEEAGEDGYNGF